MKLDAGRRASDALDGGLSGVPSGGPRSLLRREVAGLSYAEQVKRLAPPPSREPQPSSAGVVQRKEESGSATVVGAAGTGEQAYDSPEGGAFTAELQRALEARPEESIDAILAELASKPATAPEAGAPIQHPTIARIRQSPVGLGGQRRGVYVANAGYRSPNIADLPAAATDAQGLQAALAGRQFDGEVELNLTAAEMTTAYAAGTAQSQAGDSLVLYFAGHGMLEGLVGVRFEDLSNRLPSDAGSRGVGRAQLNQADAGTDPADLLPNASVATLVLGATGKGVNTYFISDSCHAGAIADALRTDQTSKLHEDDDAGRAAFGSLAEGLQSIKASMLALVLVRQQQMDEVEAGFDASGGAASDERTAALTEKEAAWDKAMLQAWQQVYRPALERHAALYEELTTKTLPAPAAAPADCATLAAEVDQIDDMANAVLAAAE